VAVARAIAVEKLGLWKATETGLEKRTETLSREEIRRAEFGAIVGDSPALTTAL